MSRYTVATDGACMRNPGPAGWAWVGRRRPLGGGLARGGHQQHRRAAGGAVCDPRQRGCRGPAHPGRLDVRDQHVPDLDGRARASRLEDQHQVRRRRTSTSWPALIDARDARRAAGLPDVAFEHVRGHAGHRLNGWADERAVRASQHGNRGLAAIWSTDRGQELHRRDGRRAEGRRGQARAQALTAA